MLLALYLYQFSLGFTPCEQHTGYLMVLMLYLHFDHLSETTTVIAFTLTVDYCGYFWNLGVFAEWINQINKNKSRASEILEKIHGTPRKTTEMMWNFLK